MILYLILGYFLFLISLSIISNRFISSDRDYLLAGRSLPLSISTFALFATWFGSETILGASQEFAKGGFLKVIEEPFGAGMCLIITGMFFARPLYRMNILTFADFYRVRYSERVENLASLFLVISYFGWIAAQFVAFGIVFKTLSGLPFFIGVLAAFFLSVFMVYLGGMWAVALTDFIQTIIILCSIGLIFGYVVYVSGGLYGLVENVPSEYFKFLPNSDFDSMIEYITAWMIIGLGSIPGQDIFQRFMSSRSERVAVYSLYIAGLMYISVALLPLFIALYSKFSLGFTENPLLEYINTLNPFLRTIFFFGLLSAILSTSSAAILAPSAIISENILPKIFKNISEKSRLFLNRISVIFVGFVSLIMAFSGESIYELVASSSVVTLVSLFAPLALGIYWKRAGEIGAMFSMVGGFTIWFLFDVILFSHTEGIVLGFLVSVFLMVIFPIKTT